VNNKEKNIKKTETFEMNRKKLENLPKKNLKLLDKIIQLIVGPEWQNTTFISQDQDSLNYVSNICFN
jgi:hypothetical protein